MIQEFILTLNIRAIPLIICSHFSTCQNGVSPPLHHVFRYFCLFFLQRLYQQLYIVLSAVKKTMYDDDDDQQQFILIFHFFSNAQNFCKWHADIFKYLFCLYANIYCASINEITFQSWRRVISFSLCWCFFSAFCFGPIMHCLRVHFTD